MKVSIITICYNSERTIEDTIHSVISQDYPNIEYIIIDGKSTDGTLKVIEKFKENVAVLISEEDNGLYDAINKGIKNATGDVVGLIHADDVLASSSVISKIAKTFTTNDCQALYGDLQYVDKSNLSKIVRNWVAGEYKKDLFLRGWMPPHPTFYAKRELFDQFGFYNDGFSSAADYELMLRFIHKYEISLAYIQEVLVKMRVGGKSNVSIKNRIKANMEDRMAWKINKIRPNLWTLWMKPLSKIHQFFSK